MDGNVSEKEKKRQRLERIVAGCIKSTMAAHGDITKEKVGSVSKRVSCELLVHLESFQ